MSRYKRRKAFVIGAVIFIILFNIMTSLVWDIEIIGNDKIANKIILEKLSEIGVHKGIFKYKIDTDQVVNCLMMEVNDLAWVGAELKGTNLKIEIVERFLPIGFQPSVKALKITGDNPAKTPELREFVRKFGVPYEADILFKYRFMSDFDLKGMSWIKAGWRRYLLF